MFTLLAASVTGLAWLRATALAAQEQQLTACACQPATAGQAGPSYWEGEMTVEPVATHQGVPYLTEKVQPIQILTWHEAKGDKILTKTTEVYQPAKLTTPAVIINGLDLSNMLPLIHRQYSRTISDLTDNSSTGVDLTQTLISGKAVLTTMRYLTTGVPLRDDTYTIVGRFDGKRFDLDREYSIERNYSIAAQRQDLAANRQWWDRATSNSLWLVGAGTVVDLGMMVAMKS